MGNEGKLIELRLEGWIYSLYGFSAAELQSMSSYSGGCKDFRIAYAVAQALRAMCGRQSNSAN